MFCKKCGHELAEDDLFCAKCGTRVGSADGPVTGGGGANGPTGFATNPTETTAPPQGAEVDVFIVQPVLRAYMGEFILYLILSLVVVGLFGLLAIWLRLKSVQYRLTTERLLVRRGLFARHVEEVELFRVKDITLDQGALQRFLGVGSIEIRSSDDSTPVLRIEGIDHPEQRKEELRRFTLEIKRVRRVGTTELIEP